MATKNRSVPVDTILPHVTYQNLAKAIEWPTRAFGFKEYYRYGNGPPSWQGESSRLRLGRRSHVLGL